MRPWLRPRRRSTLGWGFLSGEIGDIILNSAIVWLAAVFLVHAFRAQDLPAAAFFARGEDEARLAHLLVERDGAHHG